MITTDLTTLKINKLTKAQYEAALAAGNINENELYMTPESEAESGLPTVSSSDSGKTLVVNESGKWVADIVQPDWNINDSTFASYVKNRPFYTGDPVETVLLEETDVAFQKASNTIYASRMPSDLSFVVGTTYNVSWDGTLYTCISYEIGVSAVIGSQYIITGASDTGEPFIMETVEGALNVYTRDASASHIISITGLISEVVKIDKKYIPELDNYLSKDNPIGTGSFSLNRKADTTVGYYSFAEGYNTTASGDHSHAEGHTTTASGSSSHAEGSGATASGLGSHAEGTDTTASGHYSHAEGLNTIASGESSHSEGRYTTASSNYQHVQGKYNITDDSNTYADIIGNGISDAKRSNASTIDWSGNAWYAGDVYVGSTSGTNKDSGSKKLATEEYVSSLKPTVTTTTLTASNWDSTAKTYNFESTYPNASYDIEVDIDGDRCTDEQLEAWIAAKPLASSTNKINAKGDVPTVDIPIILTVTPK